MRVSIPVLLLLTVTVVVMIQSRKMTFLAFVIAAAWGFFLAKSMFSKSVQDFITSLFRSG